MLGPQRLLADRPHPLIELLGLAVAPILLYAPASQKNLTSFIRSRDRTRVGEQHRNSQAYSRVLQRPASLNHCRSGDPSSAPASRSCPLPPGTARRRRRHVRRRQWSLSVRQFGVAFRARRGAARIDVTGSSFGAFACSRFLQRLRAVRPSQTRSPSRAGETELRSKNRGESSAELPRRREAVRRAFSR